MHAITKNIGHTHNYLEPIDKTKIRRILICRPNHRLGNLLLITPLLQEVMAIFPDSSIDLFVKGNAAFLIFKNYKQVDRIIRLPKKAFKQPISYLGGWFLLRSRRYDLVINPVYYSSSGRLSAQFARGKYKFFGELPKYIQSKHDDSMHTAKSPVYGLRDFLAERGVQVNHSVIPPLKLMLTADEEESGRLALFRLVNNHKKTISLFTYATGEKCYPRTWWMEFYKRLKEICPDYNIIEILPQENISNLGYKVLAFYSRDIREIGSLIHQTQLFIGADSGIMHLSSSVHTPTIGLFSVTSQEAYQPYGSGSVSVKSGDNEMEKCLIEVQKILTSKD